MVRIDKYLITLFLIALLAFAFRIYKVDTHPSGVLIDEASFGYNAYSILKTGKDEHGIAYPLIVKAFGDQKLPAYAYSLIPSFQLFGFNNLALRLPSVIAGTLFIFAGYFLLIGIGFTKRQSLMGALIAAVSPWSIILSRFTYESNLALLFFTVALAFGFNFLKNKKTLFLILSAICFGLTWYSYIAYRLATIIVLISFLVIAVKQYKISIRNAVLFFGIFILSIAPLLPTVFSKAGTARFNQIGLFSESGIPLEVNESRTYCDEDLPKIPCYLNSNKPVIYSRAIINRFVETFSISYLFLQGEKDLKFLSVDNFGLLPIIAIPFYLVGLLYISQKILTKKITSFDIFLIISLIVTATPAVLGGSAQRVRLSPLFPFLLIIIVYGISEIEKIFKKEKYKNYFNIFIFAVFILWGIIFMGNYLTIHLKKYELSYGSFLNPLSKYLGTLDKNTEVYVKPQTEFITYYAYYNQIDPAIFQKETKWYEPNAVGFQHATDFRNIHVKDMHQDLLFCLAKKTNKKIVLVTNDNLTNTLGEKTLLKKISSYNDVYTYSFVYNINAMPEDAVLDCDTRNVN
jgi:4-amino-4-deoxy-L-arabinose transferase-like glycosyltransferase